MSLLKVFHGTNKKFNKPNISLSREDIDFGKGFYVTEEERMAKKWACGKLKSYIMHFELDLKDLKILRFELNEEWLDCIEKNRNMKNVAEFDEYDVIIGPTADDKLFNTIQDYIDGEISAKTAIEYLSIAGYSDQICLKTQKAINNLKIKNVIALDGAEKQELREERTQERKEALQKLNEIKKNINRKKRISHR